MAISSRNGILGETLNYDNIIEIEAISINFQFRAWISSICSIIFRWKWIHVDQRIDFPVGSSLKATRAWFVCLIALIAMTNAVKNFLMNLWKYSFDSSQIDYLLSHQLVLLCYLLKVLARRIYKTFIALKNELTFAFNIYDRQADLIWLGL